jgi:hypothetical protein
MSDAATASAATVSYRSVHRRVETSRGEASQYTCPCGSQAAEWAYDHLDPDEKISKDLVRYSLDPDHYLPMCIPCHKAMDLKFLAPEQVSAVMRELAARRWRGQVPARLARELVPRVDELPEIERRQLLDALTQHDALTQSTGQEQPT